MDDKELMELVRTIPEEFVQDVLDYIDELYKRYNLKPQESDPQEDS